MQENIFNFEKSEHSQKKVYTFFPEIVWFQWKYLASFSLEPK